jgi:hypothetical protein
VIEEVISLYHEGNSKAEICEEPGIKKNTLDKALSQKRVVLPPSLEQVSKAVSTGSSRNIADSLSTMGKSCVNELSRALAARYGIPCSPGFGNHLDLSYGGILLTVPSLLSCGLLKHKDEFELSKVYYSTGEVFLCLAFLMLLRVKNLEQSDNIPVGELGRCLGLDRIPGVKTLRERISRFCETGNVDEWSSRLSREWMHGDESLEGVLYVDGHVNLYYGSQTQMPKRFVSRMRLCLSGSTDYRINDSIGQPFFVVHKTVNEGMLRVLKDEIIPRLDRDVPGQPTAEELVSSPKLHRYMLVFDREGYSVDFFKTLNGMNIAFCTYRKNVKDQWADEDFTQYEVCSETADGEKMLLAERETVLKGKKEKGTPQKEITVREIRKKSSSGHQTAIITANYSLSILQIAVFMFARWSQENFFKYMVESFGIDSIVSYLKNTVPDTSQIINPEYRSLDQQHKQISAGLHNAKIKFAEISLQNKELSEKEMNKYLQKKAECQQKIKDLENDRLTVIEKKKSVDKKILFKELNDNQKFNTSLNERKFFLDTLKIIAYRAETALCNIIKKEMASPEQARSMIRKFYTSDADIHEDKVNNLLIVNVHRTNHWYQDNILEKLCNILNQSETVFPSSNLTLVFKIGTS